jgi:hypothetical protein
MCFPFPCIFPRNDTFDKRCFYQNLLGSQFQLIVASLCSSSSDLLCIWFCLSCFHHSIIMSLCRFHELVEFDETKRSCRRRLAGHNERRRKSTAESYGEGSNRKGVNTSLKESPCRQADERGRFQINIPPQGSSSYKRSQIRWRPNQRHAPSLLSSNSLILRMFGTV